MRLLFFIIAMNSFSFLFGQNSKQGIIKVEGITTNGNAYTTKRLKNVNINVYNNNDLIKSHQSDTKGKFEFNIKINSYIVLEFVKEGFFTKRILFDTKHPMISNKKTFNPFDFEIVLIPFNKDLIDFEIDFPITRIEYSEKIDELVYAEKYTKQRIEQQEYMINQLAKLEE